MSVFLHLFKSLCNTNGKRLTKGRGGLDSPFSTGTLLTIMKANEHSTQFCFRTGVILVSCATYITAGQYKELSEISTPDHMKNNR